MLAQEMLKSPYRSIATGDFNALPDSQSITLFLENTKAFGMVDATSEIPGSFHHYKGDCGTYKLITFSPICPATRKSLMPFRMMTAAVTTILTTMHFALGWSLTDHRRKNHGATD